MAKSPATSTTPTRSVVASDLVVRVSYDDKARAITLGVDGKPPIRTLKVADFLKGSPKGVDYALTYGFKQSTQDSWATKKAEAVKAKKSEAEIAKIMSDAALAKWDAIVAGTVDVRDAVVRVAPWERIARIAAEAELRSLVGRNMPTGKELGETIRQMVAENPKFKRDAEAQLGKQASGFAYSFLKAKKSA